MAKKLIKKLILVLNFHGMNLKDKIQKMLNIKIYTHSDLLCHSKSCRITWQLFLKAVIIYF